MGTCLSRNDNRKIFIKDYKNNLYDIEYWSSKEECCVCLDNKCNILLLPCDHFVLCDICCKEIYDSKKCPICQSDVYSYNLLQIISAIPNN